MRLWLAGAFLLSSTPGCNSCDAGPTPSESSARAGAPNAPSAQALRSQPTSFVTPDGAVLSGDLYLAPDSNAPALVLVHRHGANRAEWQPLIQGLARAEKRYTVLNFDLRGCGGSKLPNNKGDGAALLPEKVAESSIEDVSAAILHVLDKSGSGRVVLAGSSLGATLVARVAFGQPKVTALALISPGRAIEGMDIYRPYSEVRNLRTFIAAGDKDTIAEEPVSALGKMAMLGTIRRYPSSAHSAGFLGEKHSELWRDLSAWLMSVYDESPRERRSLYYAPGKEPTEHAVGSRPVAIGARVGLRAEKPRTLAEK